MSCARMTPATPSSGSIQKSVFPSTAHVMLTHRSRALGFQHLRAVEAALVQKSLLELEIVARRAVQAAPAHVEFGFLGQLERYFLQRSVRLARMHAGEPCAPASIELEAGIPHAERPEDVVAEIEIGRAHV